MSIRKESTIAFIKYFEDKDRKVYNRKSFATIDTERFDS